VMRIRLTVGFGLFMQELPSKQAVIYLGQ